MAKYTTTQAGNCTINRCDSFKIDGIHQHYHISATDSNGIKHEWNDATLSESPGKDDPGYAAWCTELKTAAETYVKTLEKPAPPPTREYVPEDGSVVGTAIKDL